MNYSCGECWNNTARSVGKINKCIFLPVCFIYLPNTGILTPCCCFRWMEKALKGRKENRCLRAARLQGTGGIGAAVGAQDPSHISRLDERESGPWALAKHGGDGGDSLCPGAQGHPPAPCAAECSWG